MTDNEIVKAWDILCKLDFFGGQRAGRELWNEKPADIQDKDIETFANDVAFLKDFINRQKAEIEECKKRLVEVLKGIQETNALYVRYIARAKAEAVKEFAERLKDKFPDGLGAFNAFDVMEIVDDLVAEMVGDNDAK